jgi:hypothetical protein
MSLKWIELGCLHWRIIPDVHAPGVWSLLKLRGLERLVVFGNRGGLAPHVKRVINQTVTRPALSRWHPCAGQITDRWAAEIRYPTGQPRWEVQFAFLDANYRAKHDRATVDLRRQKWRAQRRRWQRRYPMLGRHRNYPVPRQLCCS